VILVDTSVWVDHFRRVDKVLVGLLEAGSVFIHPFIVGEIALGHLRNRREVLDALRGLPQSTIAAPDEVLYFIERSGLAGRGVGYVDVHLLAAVQLAGRATFWTRDKQLLAVARQLGLAAGL
jgi:predicted nucleic acid-binding protein